MEKIAIVKVLAQGKRGLAVTIPKFYADDIGLKRGDEMEVFRDKDSIRLFKKHNQRVSEKTDIFDDDDDQSWAPPALRDKGK